MFLKIESEGQDMYLTLPLERNPGISLSTSVIHDARGAQYPPKGLIGEM